MSDVYDLVFEGGGAKGAAFVGAMKAFYQRGCKHRRLIGTSAGAITATLLAAGFTPDDLYSFVKEKKDDTPVFTSFMDVPQKKFCEQFIETSDIFKELDKESSLFFSFIELISKAAQRETIENLLHIQSYRQLFCFIECGGLYAGEEFLRWMKSKLSQKMSSDITLSDFYKKTGTDLSLLASNTSKCRILVLNHRTAPDCPVAWAVRMSMSIPFVWSEVIWREEWGKYLNEEMAGDRIVDGGMLSNFPLFLVEKDAEGHHNKTQIMGIEIKDEDAGTIGLLIDETLPVPEQKNDIQCSISGKLKTVNRVNTLINTMCCSHDNEVIRNNPHLICRLPAKGYGTTEFDMPDYRLDALITAGKKAMENHLDQRKAA
ncbi:patatin-like phospholipase family protein [Candidatus Electronema sp. JM]|uniref:patatin-like phospholipase family protein n=1 Tax=Candidatus Electronema sp. JM TaxID=3401571 RepID=UPI003AA7E5CC